MYFDPEFLFDNQLVASIEDLIRKSKKHLLLISPFIDLDARIKDALSEKKQSPDFELLVLFGKNENDFYRSVKRDSFEFLKGFPNIEVRYNERLHAKFYQNDYDFIISSMNLLDYSLARNIEVGIRFNYSSKGLLGKIGDSADNLIAQGVNKVRHGVLGEEKETDPLDKFQLIYQSSEIVYKTKPKINTSKILGVTTKTKLEGFNIIINKLDSNPLSQVQDLQIESLTTEVKYISASQLSKNFGTNAKEITAIMEKKGLIKNGVITDSGKEKGLILKSYMGREYIAYPENMIELKELKK